MHRRRDPVLISAHRMGPAGPARWRTPWTRSRRRWRWVSTTSSSTCGGCDDGTFVVAHDSWVAVGDHHLPISSLTRPARAARRHPGALRRRAGPRRRTGPAHIDLKFTSPDEAYADPASTYEVAAVRRAVERLGTGYLLVTTARRPRRPRGPRLGGRARATTCLVGLSLGRSVRGLPWLRQVRVRLSELLPRLRLPRVAGQPRRRPAHARPARRRGVRPAPRACRCWSGPSTPRTSLRYWLRPGRAWLVTTNQPGLALRMQGRASAGDALGDVGREVADREDLLVVARCPRSPRRRRPAPAARRRRGRSRAAPSAMHSMISSLVPPAREGRAGRVVGVLQRVRDLVRRTVAAATAATGGQHGQQA